VIPTRSLQLLVGNPFAILWGIPNAFSVSPLTHLSLEESFKISALQMMNKCSLFQNNSTFWGFPHRVQSPVSLSLCLSVSLSLSIFRQFICALDGNAIKITDQNFIELEEFYLTELAAKLSNFHPSINFKERAAETKTKQKQK
jgi:hypothetical protein